MLALDATWPPVGRAEELERIVRARADGGCSGLVLSAGIPGLDPRAVVTAYPRIPRPALWARLALQPVLVGLVLVATGRR
jgi:hypothetical protein